MNMREFGSRISMLRKTKGWTQEKLAEQLGVTYQAVSKWETAQSYPDITLLPVLADVLDVSLDEMFGREPSAPQIAEEAEAVQENMLYGALYLGSRLLSRKEAQCTGVPLVLEYHGTLNGPMECSGDIHCIDSQINGSIQTAGDIRLENCGDIQGSLTAGGDIVCSHVNGTVNAQGNVICGDVGTVVGNVTAEGDVACGNVGYDVNADGDVSCKNVGFNVNAEGDVDCGNVGGSVCACGDVACGKVTFDVNAEGDVTCMNVGGNVTAEGDASCLEIGGTAQAGGDVFVQTPKSKNIHLDSGADFERMIRQTVKNAMDRARRQLDLAFGTDEQADPNNGSENQ